ncbi:hypothetical protein [Paraburkholderia sediminicola]|uniref:hypothetical protein n=1 Tax=Paraburkholderia sediminicola TaxID=458836 RepID=UPI0038B7050B
MLLSELGLTRADLIALGGRNFADLCAQLVYWKGKERSENGIYKTAEELRKETGLSAYQQRKARAQMVALGFMSESYRRLEHRMYFKLDTDKLKALVSGLVKRVVETVTKTVHKAVRAIQKVISKEADVSKELTEAEMMLTFEWAWNEYPKKTGDSRARAEREWTNRVKEGVDPLYILRGIRGYWDHFARVKMDDKYVISAGRFFGPDKHYEGWA